MSIRNEASYRVFIVRCNIVEPGARCCLCGTYEIMQALRLEMPKTIREETIQQYLRGTVSLGDDNPCTVSLKEVTILVVMYFFH